MIIRNRAVYLLWLFAIVWLNAKSLRSSQSGDTKTSLAPAYSTDDSVLVRFCDLDEENYFHIPLIFRGVKVGDQRLNTAPIVPQEGRTAYVSGEELDELIRRLGQSDLSWKESKEIESIKWDLPKGHLPCSAEMEVLVVSSKGSWRAKISPKKLCAELVALDPAFHSPRALWEFQLFRHGYGCKVRGFNFEAYPDH